MIDPQVNQTLEKQGIKKLMFKGNKQKKRWDFKVSWMYSWSFDHFELITFTFAS